MCVACRNLLKNARFTKAMTSVRAANESTIEALKTDIRNSILTEIRNEIRTNFKEMIDTVPLTPLNSIPLLPPPSSRKKRPRDTENEDDTLRRPAKLLCGTNSVTNDAVPMVKIAEPRPEQFWLYLSGIHPSVSDENIKILAQKVLGTDEIAVAKLVPRGKDARSLTFISFKIGMSIDLKEKAMCVDTWPVGIKFREFANTGSTQAVFWKPSDRNNPPVAQSM